MYTITLCPALVSPKATQATTQLRVAVGSYVPYLGYYY